MRIKNGFITKYEDNTIKFHNVRPTCTHSFWYSDNYVILRPEMFDDVDLGDRDKSLKQVHGGKLIMPLPELRVDDKVMDSSGLRFHFSHFNEEGGDDGLSRRRDIMDINYYFCTEKMETSQ